MLPPFPIKSVGTRKGRRYTSGFIRLAIVIRDQPRHWGLFRGKELTDRLQRVLRPTGRLEMPRAEPR